MEIVIHARNANLAEDFRTIATEKLKALDLLNENIGIDTSFRLKHLAKEAVDFLKLSKEKVRNHSEKETLKLYLKPSNANRN